MNLPTGAFRFAHATALALVLGLFAASLHAEEPSRLASEECLRCHGDPTCREAEDAGKPCGLTDKGELSRSEHAAMECTDCHAKAFAKVPHPETRRASCTDCHSVNERNAGGGKEKAGVLFGDIREGFQKSFHKDKVAAFRCTDCHDAHAFQLATARDHKSNHNVICLGCHTSRERFQKLVEKEPPDIDKAHSWLPNREMHWSRIRCIDCHTGYDAPERSHLILAKADAVKTCETCHSAKPVQLLRLYSRMREREVQRLGFLKSTFVNDTYVVGATRNAAMDLYAILLIGATLGGVLGHGALRLLAARLKKKSGGAEPHHKESLR